MALNIFKRFDNRLTAELRTQRRLILKGLACVIVTSVLTGATVPLIGQAVQAISDASAQGGRTYAEQKYVSKDEVALLASRLNRTEPQVIEVLSNLQATRNLSGDIMGVGEALAIARNLSVPADQVQKSLTEISEKRKAKHQTPRDAVNKLGFISLLVIGVYAMKYWFTRGQTYYLSKASARLASDLRLRLFNKLQRLPISYFNERRTGGIQSVLTNDVNVYQTAVTIIRDSIDGPIKALSAFVFIVWTQWQLAMVTLLFLPAMAIAIQRNGRKMKEAQGQVQADLAELNGMTTEALTGTRVVKAFSAQDRVGASYSRLVEKSFGSQMKAVKRQSSLRPLVELIGAVALATVLYICGWLAFNGVLNIGQLASLVFALDVINQGARNLGSVNNTYNQVQAASERIYREVLDVPEESEKTAGSRTILVPEGRIEFRDVVFNYPDGTEALKGVSFTLDPGSSLALVGPSGAGKSTIADLLLRFYRPTLGQILFDGIDIQELDVHWLRSQIGVVPQQTFLFAGTISENIRMGKDDATDREVLDASKAAHAEEFINQMPLRFESELGERGTRLSGGQMQRVAIARALIRKPTLLLLDEATSALDAQSEKAVQSALDTIMKERTTLFIAHRLTTAARANRILVLRSGQVIEVGSHQELLAQNGAYASMYHAFGNGEMI
jgi:subfamily B ATP-binding cassette protein MsbA